MRKSQIAVLSAFAVIAVFLVVAVIAARIIIARIDSGQYGSAVPPEPQVAGLDSGSLNLSGFNRVDARGVWDVTLTQGSDWSVKLDYPQRLKDRLQVRVDGDRLVLGYERRGWFGFGGGDERVKANIVMPELEAVDTSGAATLNVSGFSGEKLSITSAGAAKIEGRDSRYDELQLIVSGAGDVNLGRVPVHDARVVLSGAGNVTLDMEGGTLSGTVSGAGKVLYHGQVEEQKIVVSGFSSVEALD